MELSTSCGCIAVRCEVSCRAVGESLPRRASHSFLQSTCISLEDSANTLFESSARRIMGWPELGADLVTACTGRVLSMITVLPRS